MTGKIQFPSMWWLFRQHQYLVTTIFSWKMQKKQQYIGDRKSLENDESKKLILILLGHTRRFGVQGSSHHQNHALQKLNARWTITLYSFGKQLPDLEITMPPAPVLNENT